MVVPNRWRWAELDEEGERAFRAEQLGAARAHAEVAIAVQIAIAWLSLPNDFALTIPEARIPSLVVARAFTSLVGIVSLLAIRRTAAARTVDRWAAAWFVAFVVAKFYVLAARPPDFFGYVPGNIVFFGLALVTFSYSFRMQVWAAAVCMLADAGIFAFYRHPIPPTVILPYSIAYVVAVGIGLFFGRSLNHAGRLQFLAYQRETAIRESLERALAEVRTLRGIIPICASCKHVRDDQGFWHRVEVYVRAHTDADFSHSLCPACIRTLYPDMADEMLAEPADVSGASSPSWIDGSRA